MNDQVQLPKHLGATKPSDNRATTVPQITSAKDGYGDPLLEGGVTRHANLYFTGTGPSGTWLEIWDNGLPYGSLVLVKEDGSFYLEMLDQSLGLHEYALRDPNEPPQMSAPWRVYVDVAQTVSIEYVGDARGPIEHNGSTTYNKLEFVGRGVAGSTVTLFDNGNTVRTADVDAGGYWNAMEVELQTGSHHFTAQGEDDVSRPFSVLINKAAPLTIEYAVGQQHFQKIVNNGTTADDAVVLVGIANPGEKGRIVDASGDLRGFIANQHGVWEATIQNLVAGPYYQLRLISDSDRQSLPFLIRVLSSKSF